VAESSGLSSGRENASERLSLPRDSTTTYSREVVAWIQSSSLSVETCIRHGIVYSPSLNQLIFPYYDYETKELCCTQARNFDPYRKAKAKYFNRGSTSRVIQIYHRQKNNLELSNPNIPVGTTSERNSNQLVITEDAFSSLRIAPYSDAMPALGTQVPLHKIIAIKGYGYEVVKVWLDSDKWREARDIAEAFKSVGLSASTIFTELDPKSYSNEQIQEFIK